MTKGCEAPFSFFLGFEMLGMMPRSADRVEMGSVVAEGGNCFVAWAKEDVDATK